jgi:quinol monooxygenase YgiN
MTFLQIIDCRTSKIDEISALDEQYRAATEGTRTLRRSIVARDRNDPDRHFVLAFFDDYDSAMVNSNLPETGEFASKLQELLAGPPTFVDLEVVQDLT